MVSVAFGQPRVASLAQPVTCTSSGCSNSRSAVAGSACDVCSVWLGCVAVSAGGAWFGWVAALVGVACSARLDVALVDVVLLLPPLATVTTMIRAMNTPNPIRIFLPRPLFFCGGAGGGRSPKVGRTADRLP